MMMENNLPAKGLFPLYGKALETGRAIYARSENFFPLIAAVLEGSEKGSVFGDDPGKPVQFYVEHSFGFSQIFGETRNDFENALENYLLVKKSFAVPKVRLYTPHVPFFFANGAFPQFRSERQRFFLDRTKFAGVRDRYKNRCVSCRSISTEIMPQIEKYFPLVKYFWPDTAAFAEKSLAQIVFADNVPVAICYAAAIAESKAEVDIFTLPQWRGKGYATTAAISFMENCLKNSIEPLWDCFTNNAGSMRLAALLGFAGASAPYQFFTIPG